MTNRESAMGIHVTTEDLQHVSAVDRFGLWEDLVSHNVLGQDIRYKSTKGLLHGSIRTTELAGLLMARVCCSSAQSVARSRSRIDRTTVPVAILCMQISGTAELIIDGDSVRMNTGDWTLCDCARQYSWNFSDNHGQHVLIVPKQKLRDRLNMPELVHGQVLSGKTGVGKITWDFITSMWYELVDGKLNLNPRFEDITLELLSSAINESVGVPREISRSHVVRLLEVKAFINSHIKDPGLYVEAISRALNISPRYLHLLFQKEQTTIAQYIRDLRLEKCARDLGDANLAHRSITDIAFTWGFSSHAHFSKLFKAKYSMSARDYRREHTM